MALIHLLLNPKVLKKKLKNLPWVMYAHIGVLIVGMFVVPFILVPWIFSALQPIMVHDEAGYTIFVSAAHVATLGSFVLFPFLYLSLSYLVSYAILQFPNYRAAQKIDDQSVRTGSRKKQPKGKSQQRRMLWQLKRSVCVVAFLTFLAVPFVYLSSDNYILVHDEGITVDPFTSLTSRSYSWSDIHSSELSIEKSIRDGRRTLREVKYTPELRITFSDNTSVDLWQFNSLSADEVITLCIQLDDHGVEVEQGWLSNISGLRQSVQKDIQQVWDAPACGAFSLR